MELVIIIVALVCVPLWWKRKHPVHVERFETMRTSLDKPIPPTTPR